MYGIWRGHTKERNHVGQIAKDNLCARIATHVCQQAECCGCPKCNIRNPRLVRPGENLGDNIKYPRGDIQTRVGGREHKDQQTSIDDLIKPPNLCDCDGNTNGNAAAPVDNLAAKASSLLLDGASIPRKKTLM